MQGLQKPEYYIEHNKKQDDKPIINIYGLVSFIFSILSFLSLIAIIIDLILFELKFYYFLLLLFSAPIRFGGIFFGIYHIKLIRKFSAKYKLKWLGILGLLLSIVAVELTLFLIFCILLAYF